MLSLSINVFLRSNLNLCFQILEVSRSEYEPSDMDILQAEGLSSMEGLSCVDFSFPSNTQEVSLDTDDQHDPNMKLVLYLFLELHSSYMKLGMGFG